VPRRPLPPAADLEALRADNRHLGNLLAVIHGDGGHYQQQHGTAKACEDATDKWYAMKGDKVLSDALGMVSDLRATIRTLRAAAADALVTASELIEDADGMTYLDEDQLEDWAKESAALADAVNAAKEVEP
jgi:hypothetical protein